LYATGYFDIIIIMDSKYVKYTSLYIFAYLAIGTMMPLISQYLKSIGFTGTQTGTVTAAATCVAIFASAFWGRVYANSARKHIVVIALCLLAAAAALGISHIYSFVLFSTGYCIMYFFQAPIMALNDAMTIEDRQPFGFVRMWGAVGFAVGVLIAARVAEAAGTDKIFIMYALAYTAAAFTVVLIGAPFKKADIGSRDTDIDGREACEKRQTAKKRYRDLRHEKDLIRLIICCFFFCGTNVANNTYFSFLYIDGGGTLAGVGLAFLLMAGSETPFMAWTARLAQRFTAEKMIMAAMAVSVCRFAWYFSCPPYWMLLLTFMLQGFVNGIILVEFVRYVSRLVRKEYESVAIAAYYAFGSNLSTIVCQLAGGAILDRWGSGGVYLFFALMNAVGLLLYVLFGLHRQRPKNSADDRE